MEVAHKLVLIFVVSFAVIIPFLEADMAQYDDFWKKKSEEAQKNMMASYVPTPLDVTKEVESQVNKDKEKHGTWDSGKNGTWDSGKNGAWESGKNGNWDSGKNGTWDWGKKGTWDSGKNGTWDSGKNGTWGSGKNGTWDSGKNGTLDSGKNGTWESGNKTTGSVHTATNSSTNDFGIEKETNNSRRNLRQGKRVYKGPCHATNPIDRCWRCKHNWDRQRKRLAKCALGFGRRTTGGLAGKIYVVTDNCDDNVLEPKRGTLRHAVIQKEPLWIIFARDMNIKLTKELLICNNKTIDGRGANVHIAYGAGITIQFVSNVIIHGLHIHHISATGGGMIRDSTDHCGIRTQSDGDGISIFGATNIWIDHVSMSKCQDGLIDAIQGSTAITISNSHFTHHNDAILLGASDSFSGDQFMQVTVAFNHFGQGLVQRMPRCRWGFFHVINNDYTHWMMYAIGGSMHPTIISQGNRFIAPDNLALKEVTKRDYAPESEWKKWIWKSEGDLLMNGAFFVQSGPQLKIMPSKKYLIKAKAGAYATKMTRFAGALNCRPGRKC